MRIRTKILVYLAIWKRPEITELCFRGLERLKTHPDFDIEVFAVISEESMIPLCEKYNVRFILHENLPLGKKKNAGLKALESIPFDYLMEIGSDDLVLNELLDSYKPFIEAKIPFFGIVDAGYIDSETGACRRLISRMSTYGAGRMIHWSLLAKFGFKLWKDEISKGLDNNSVFGLMRTGVDYKQVEPMAFPGIIDVKGPDNIWKFNHLVGVKYDIEEIFSRISEEEVGMIKAMYEPVTQE